MQLSSVLFQFYTCRCRLFCFSFTHAAVVCSVLVLHMQLSSCCFRFTHAAVVCSVSLLHMQLSSVLFQFYTRSCRLCSVSVLHMQLSSLFCFSFTHAAVVCSVLVLHMQLSSCCFSFTHAAVVCSVSVLHMQLSSVLFQFYTCSCRLFCFQFYTCSCRLCSVSVLHMQLSSVPLIARRKQRVRLTCTVQPAGNLTTEIMFVRVTNVSVETCGVVFQTRGHCHEGDATPGYRTSCCDGTNVTASETKIYALDIDAAKPSDYTKWLCQSKDMVDELGTVVLKDGGSKWRC